MKLIDILERLNLLHSIEVEDHSVIPLCDLKQIIVEVQLEALATLESGEVCLRHFCHLNVLDILLIDHLFDFQSMAHICLVQPLCVQELEVGSINNVLYVSAKL